MHYLKILIPLIIGFCTLVLLGYSCNPPANPNKKYLFIGHAYQWGAKGKRIDFRVEKLDFSSYDQVWLGGDVCGQTTQEASTLNYLDSLFDLDSERFHWALGNHDVMDENLHFITDRTKRPTFYTTSFDGICLLVLNTNLYFPPTYIPDPAMCEEMEQQIELIKTVTDTIHHSSHLIVLHHYGLLGNLILDEQEKIFKPFNVNITDWTVGCQDSTTFEKTIYPLLIKVQSRGVQVTMIAGDVGQRKKKFDYQLKNGIRLLGSGINNSVKRENAPDYVRNFDPDHLLILTHDTREQKLNWEFRELNEMVK
ncbi:MAG: hypothetical protein GY705_04910 [Bacteroidetes bacterium]|nr:hypothetical protein [Bacteroidota bacterium]